MKCSLWLGQGWQKLDPKSRGLHHGCLAPLAEGTGKPSALDSGEPVLCKRLARVQSFLALSSCTPHYLLLPLLNHWLPFGILLLRTHQVPPSLFFSSIPDLCAPCPIAMTLRNLL